MGVSVEVPALASAVFEASGAGISLGLALSDTGPALGPASGTGTAPVLRHEVESVEEFCGHAYGAGEVLITGSAV